MKQWKEGRLSEPGGRAVTLETEERGCGGNKRSSEGDDPSWRRVCISVSLPLRQV